MQNTQTTAGQTAPRTLVIFRDCHAKNNIVVTANSDREEEKIRLRAMSHGFLVAVRKPKALMQHMCNSCASGCASNPWHKPSALAAMPRPKLFGAFRLSLTPCAKEGGEQ